MKRDLLVAGFPNGDISVYHQIFKLPQSAKAPDYKQRMHTVQMAHAHLIRSIISLCRLKHRYFYSLDVCGRLKVWSATPVPKEVLVIELDAGIGYNSTVELPDLIPPSKRSSSLFSNSTAILCVSKARRVSVILVDPVRPEAMVVREFSTQYKPTAVIPIQ